MAHLAMVVASLHAEHGGPPHAVLSLAEAISRHGIRVSVVAPFVPGRALDPAFERVSSGHDVEIHLVPIRRMSRFRFSLALAREVRRTLQRADVVTIHGFYQWPTVIAWRAARRAGAPLIVQPHGVFEPYQEAHSRLIKRVFMRLVGDAILRDSLFLAAASTQEVKGLQELRTSAPIRAVEVGLGIDRRGDPLPSYDARAVLFLSRIALKKRLDLLIEAIRILNRRGVEVTLHVCGDGNDAYANGVRQAAHDLKNVWWHGHVSGATREAVEAQCSLMCLPSDNENFGQAVTEAMAAKLPVITTQGVGASQHVIRASSGWVLSEPTANELAEALEEALDNPERLREMGDRGAEYCEGSLGWDQVASRWLAELEL